MTASTEIAKPNSQQHKKNHNHSKIWNRTLLGLILLLGLSVISLFLRINYLIHLQNNQLQQSIKNLNAKQMNTSLSSLKKLTKISQDFDEKYIKLDHKISKTLQETRYISNDWIMQKAKYYLELAVINNTWTSDVNTTKKLLNAADSTLKNIQNDGISEVRKLIAYESLQVSSIKKIDTIKLLAEIDAINTYLRKLPIITLKKQISQRSLGKLDNTKSMQDPANTWRDNLKNNLKKLNDLIIIRHNSEDATQFLSPSYLLTIRETLKLNLQQMQWAILEKNQKVFNLSCKQAIDNFNYAIETSNIQKETIIQQLKQLQKINLHLTKVKIGQSLTKLNTVIASTENTITKEEQHAD